MQISKSHFALQDVRATTDKPASTVLVKREENNWQVMVTWAEGDVARVTLYIVDLATREQPADDIPI